MAQAHKVNEINIDNISFSNPKTLDNGGKMVFVNYNNGKFFIETPELEIPFDARYFGEDNNNSLSSKNGKYAIKVQLKDSDESTAKFKEVLKKMDTLLKESASQNSQAWFKKPKLSLDTLNELYTPFVTVSRDRDTGEPDGKYADTFGFKVHKRDSRFPDFCIYDNKKNVFDVNGDNGEPDDLLNYFKKGALLKVVLKCNGIWIANGKFGCTWKAEQVRIKVPEEGLRAFAIESDEDDSDEEVVEEKLAPTMIEDSDEDEQEEQAPEPEPEPEPVKKKKVRKVKVNKD
jgi:hypothetical protein